MSRDQILILMALAAAYMLLTAKKPAQANQSEYTTEIVPDGATNGWRYFSDGTAIAPGGAVYKGGVLMWSPAG